MWLLLRLRCSHARVRLRRVLSVVEGVPMSGARGEATERRRGCASHGSSLRGVQGLVPSSSQRELASHGATSVAAWPVWLRLLVCEAAFSCPFCREPARPEPSAWQSWFFFLWLSCASRLRGACSSCVAFPRRVFVAACGPLVFRRCPSSCGAVGLAPSLRVRAMCPCPSLAPVFPSRFPAPRMCGPSSLAGLSPSRDAQETSARRSMSTRRLERLLGWPSGRVRTCPPPGVWRPSSPCLPRPSFPQGRALDASRADFQCALFSHAGPSRGRRSRPCAPCLSWRECPFLSSARPRGRCFAGASSIVFRSVPYRAIGFSQQLRSVTADGVSGRRPWSCFATVASALAKVLSRVVSSARTGRFSTTVPVGVRRPMLRASSVRSSSCRDPRPCASRFRGASVVLFYPQGRAGDASFADFLGASFACRVVAQASVSALRVASSRRECRPFLSVRWRGRLFACASSSVPSSLSCEVHGFATVAKCDDGRRNLDGDLGVASQLLRNLPCTVPPHSCGGCRRWGGWWPASLDCPAAPRLATRLQALRRRTWFAGGAPSGVRAFASPWCLGRVVGRGPSPPLGWPRSRAGVPCATACLPRAIRVFVLFLFPSRERRRRACCAGRRVGFFFVLGGSPWRQGLSLPNVGVSFARRACPRGMLCVRCGLSRRLVRFLCAGSRRDSSRGDIVPSHLTFPLRAVRDLSRQALLPVVSSEPLPSVSGEPLVRLATCGSEVFLALEPVAGPAQCRESSALFERHMRSPSFWRRDGWCHGKARHLGALIGRARLCQGSPDTPLLFSAWCLVEQKKKGISWQPPPAVACPTPLRRRRVGSHVLMACDPFVLR